jgi:hypothetical protein
VDAKEAFPDEHHKERDEGCVADDGEEDEACLLEGM